MDSPWRLLAQIRESGRTQCVVSSFSWTIFKLLNLDIPATVHQNLKSKFVLQLLTVKNVNYLRVEVKYLVQQQAKIIKRLNGHSAVFMVDFILYKQLKMASFFKTKRVSKASCCAMQRLKYRGRFGFKHPWVERTNRGVSQHKHADPNQNWSGSNSSSPWSILLGCSSQSGAVQLLR